MPPTPTLLVDNNHTFLHIARAFLDGHAGFSVVGVATGGNEALVQAKRLQPELVLIDLIMPDRSGLETLPELRESLPTSTIIAISFNVDDSYREAALKAGADAFIAKEHLSTELLPTVLDISNSKGPGNSKSVPRSEK